MLKFNPFKSYSITGYNQYKDIPILEGRSLKNIRGAIQSQIRDNFRFPERALVLGERGIGKSSTLFFIRDLLEQTKTISVFMFSKLISNSEDFFNLTNIEFAEASNKPMYLLIDFPDTINQSQFKRFQEYIWNLMTHRNYKNINLIFAMNSSHLDYALGTSEILGKFQTKNLEKMDRDETETLIKLRLTSANNDNFFSKEVYDMIFSYSKGIPRNIVCACSSLVDRYFDNEHITEEQARDVLINTYSEQIIKDRVDDFEERVTFGKIMTIIENDFRGKVLSQENLITKTKEQLGIGRNKTMKMVNSLAKFGLLTVTKGGERNNNKIISLI